MFRHLWNGCILFCYFKFLIPKTTDSHSQTADSKYELIVEFVFMFIVNVHVSCKILIITSFPLPREKKNPEGDNSIVLWS